MIGVDFGLSVTDAVLLSSMEMQAHMSLHRPGPASEALLRRTMSKLLAGAGPESAGAEPAVAGVTGGRSGQLPDSFEGVRIAHVREPDAIGRGGLALAGLERALLVSCGTGPAMIMADAAAGRFAHLSGTAVGGGTLEGLATHLLGVRDASAVAELGQRGDAAGVDTTLGEVLGGGVGNLPPGATAVNLGRLADLDAPDPADLAAGLVTMVAQTIALIALNAARAAALPEVVFVGRLAEFNAVRGVLEDVFALYGAGAPRFPAGAAHATALGAALAAEAVLELEDAGA
jgi:type II pantothenate kinase